MSWRGNFIRRGEPDKKRGRRTLSQQLRGKGKMVVRGKGIPPGEKA